MYIFRLFFSILCLCLSILATAIFSFPTSFFYALSNSKFNMRVLGPFQITAFFVIATMALPTPSTGGSSVYVSENPSRVGASRLVPRRHPGKETGYDCKQCGFFSWTQEGLLAHECKTDRNDGTWQDDDDADGDGD